MTENETTVSIEEIRELALRYIDESECAEPIRPNEVFAFQARPMPSVFGKKSKNWLFAGYGLLLDYTVNPDEKPYGKWITMRYLNLTVFPPQAAEIRLQPPHIAKGYFQSFDRTNEMKIIPVSPEIFETDDNDRKEAEIVKFPGTK
jgi:hypothetical protein